MRHVETRTLFPFSSGFTCEMSCGCAPGRSAVADPVDEVDLTYLFRGQYDICALGGLIDRSRKHKRSVEINAENGTIETAEGELRVPYIARMRLDRVESAVPCDGIVIF